MKSRRTVTHAGQRPGSGGRARLWAYGYSDLARLLGTTEAAMRARVARGTVFPGDLEWVCNQHHMYVERCADELRLRGR